MSEEEKVEMPKADETVSRIIENSEDRKILEINLGDND